MRDFSGIVGLAELGINLAHRLAEAGFEAGQGIGTCGIVRREDEGRGEACLFHMRAHCFVQVVVLPGGVEVIFVAQLARQRRRACIGRQIDRAATGHAGNNGHREVGPDDAGQDIDLFALDHFVGQRLGDIGFLGVVAHDNFDIIGTRHLQRQHETVMHVLAEMRAATRQRGNHTDLGIGQRRACKQ